MKFKTIIQIIIIIFTFLTFYAGVFRHDVDKKEYLNLANQKQFDCVGEVFKDSKYSGSCVLINERYVLSAAHIFIDGDSEIDTQKINGQIYLIPKHYNFRQTAPSHIILEFKGQKVNVKNIWVNPNYLVDVSKNFWDIALLELENPIENIITPSINKGFNELNSEAVGVGYGSSGPANSPDLVNNYHRKIAGKNIVDSIGGDTYLGQPIYLLCDFDHPTRTDCNKLGSPNPLHLEYIATGGDSGGGLFRKNEYGWELIGIFSGIILDTEQFAKTNYYGQKMRWTRTSVFANWIDSLMK